MIGADDIVFCPDPSTEWWKVFTGSQAVPQGVANYGSDALSMTGDLQEVFGMFGYAAMSHNPVAIEQFAGNNWLHAIAAKYAWCKATVAGFKFTTTTSSRSKPERFQNPVLMASGFFQG